MWCSDDRVSQKSYFKLLEGEFSAADVEGIEGVGAVGAVFEQVFFGFGELFAGFVFTEAVAPSAYSGRLNGEDKVFVVGAVEGRHEALLTCESLVYEQVFFIMAHRVAEVHSVYLPPPALKFMY